MNLSEPIDIRIVGAIVYLGAWVMFFMGYATAKMIYQSQEKIERRRAQRWAKKHPPKPWVSDAELKSMLRLREWAVKELYESAETYEALRMRFDSEKAILEHQPGESAKEALKKREESYRSVVEEKNWEENERKWRKKRK